MIKNKSLQKQKSARWAKFQQWNRKWNTIMVRVFSVLVFGLLFGIVIVNSTSENASQTDYRRSGRSSRASALDEKKCEVYCYRSENITECVESGVAKKISNDIDCTSVGYNVVVAFAKFSDDKISHGWLKSTEFITKLTIQDNYANRYIKEIEPGAFNDSTFRSVLNFELRETSITELSEGVLHGLNNLKSLFLNRNNEMRLFDENALDPICQLDELRIENQDQLEYLRNITGKMEFKDLHTLMLSNNSLGRIINSETFTGCTQVVTLNLAFSKIEAIGASSFDPMAETIEVLDLSGNFLTHLPSNLLANMIRPNMKFYLSKNLWNCDCTSLELQGYDINNSSLIVDSPLECDMPESERGNQMKNVSILECSTSSVIPSTTTTTATTTTTISTPNTEASTNTEASPTTRTTTNTATTTTTTSSTAISTPNIEASTITSISTTKPNLDRLNCYDQTIRYTSDFIDLETVQQYFYVKQLGIGKVSIKLHHPDSNLAMLILNNVDNEVKCQYNIKSEMIFDDLNPQSAHAFCLMNKNSSSTSPRNCVPFYFNDTKSIWSHDEIIIAVVCSTVLALVLGILIGCLLSFRYQRFFKLKDSQEYKSSGSSTYKTTEKFYVSIASEYHPGKSSMDTNNTILRLRRSISENSFATCESCKTKATLSPFEITQWRLMKSNDYHIKATSN